MNVAQEYLQQPLQATFAGLQNALLPRALKVHTRSFGLSLSPVTSSAQDDSISELLRFL